MTPLSQFQYELRLGSEAALTMERAKAFTVCHLVPALRPLVVFLSSTLLLKEVAMSTRSCWGVQCHTTTFCVLLRPTPEFRLSPQQGLDRDLVISSLPPGM